MRYLIIAAFLLPIVGNSQRSIVEAIMLFSSSNKNEFIKEDHTSYRYIMHYDSEVKIDTTITIEGQNLPFKLANTRAHTWENNIFKIVETSFVPESKKEETFGFDSLGNVIVHEIKSLVGEASSFINEKKLYTYDDKNRLV